MIEKNEMIFGIRAVIEAIEAGKEIDKVLIKKDMQSELAKELFAALKQSFIPVQRVPVERIDRITRKNHQGVVAFISPITYQRTEDLVPFLFEQGKNPLFILLDGITDVRNFGAIARTCECAGVDAIIIPSKNSVGKQYPQHHPFLERKRIQDYRGHRKRRLRLYESRLPFAHMHHHGSRRHRRSLRTSGAL